MEAVFEKDETAIDYTKRILANEPAYRLRLTETELKFLLHILEERIATSDDIMKLYGLSKRDNAFKEEKNVMLVAKNMVRRFTGTLKGKKRHFGYRAWWASTFLVSKWEKQNKKKKVEVDQLVEGK
jgi:hypothetical protein